MTTDGVIRALEAALAAAPGDLEVRRHLIERLLSLDAADDAVPHAHLLLEHGAGDTDALDLAIRVFETVGDDATAAALDAGRRAMPVTGDDAILPVPDTADELLSKWDDSAAPEEITFGELTASDVTLADIGGLDEVKRQLERSFLAPLRNPELAAAFRKW